MQCIMGALAMLQSAARVDMEAKPMPAFVQAALAKMEAGRALST